MPTTDRLLNVTEAASMLGLKPKTLYQLKNERRIPYCKPFGKSLRFKLSDLQKIIEESTTPIQEL